MKLHCGIDLHANNCLIGVLNEQDQVVCQNRLPNDLELILSLLQPWKEALQGCVVESTYNWYWLVDGLLDAGHVVHLANIAAIPQYDGIKYTNDSSNALHLARLLRLGILPEGYIYPREERAVRDLLRRRLLIVRQRTQQILSLQNLIARETGRRFSGNQIKQLKDEQIKVLLSEPQTAYGAGVSPALMQSLDQAASMIEREVSREAAKSANYQLLTSIPGVGAVLGLTIALETGHIERFADAGHYAGVKSEKLSNGKRKGQGNRKNGNRYLAWAFAEAAHFATV